MLLAGLVSGRGSLRAAWLWGYENFARIRDVLGFRATLDCPSYGTVWYALQLCDEVEVARAMQAWTESVLGHPVLLSADGKTLRGSQRRKKHLLAKQVVSVAAPELSAVLTQQVVVDGDALDALLVALQQVCLAGTLLTVAAGLISPAVIDVVTAAGGLVLAPVKGNYPEVQEAITTYGLEQRPSAQEALTRAALSETVQTTARAATEARSKYKKATTRAAKATAAEALALAAAAAGTAAADLTTAVTYGARPLSDPTDGGAIPLSC